MASANLARATGPFHHRIARLATLITNRLRMPCSQLHTMKWKKDKDDSL